MDEMHAMQRRLLALALYCLAENDDDESVDLQALQTRASPLAPIRPYVDRRNGHLELGQADERLAARSDQVGVSAQFFIFDHGGEHRAMPVLRRELELWHFAEEASRAVPQVRTDAGHTREGDRRRRRRHGKLTRTPNFKKSWT